MISKLAGSSLCPCGNGRSPKRTGNSARWGSRRSPHKARLSKSSPVSDSIVVVRPFHPLSGQRLKVLFEKARPGVERVVVCEGGPPGRVTLPAGWTDRVPGPSTHRLSADGLIALAELMGALDARAAVLRPATIEKLTSALGTFGEFISQRYPEVTSLKKLQRTHVDASDNWIHIAIGEPHPPGPQLVEFPGLL